MATSGTYTFTITRDEIIGAALRTLGAFGVADTIPANDIANCAQALNIMAKGWIKRGLPLWCVEQVSVPMVVGQLKYNLNLSTVGNYKPGRVLDAFLTDPTGNDVSLSIVSRYDYDTLGYKTSPGVPNQLFFDPQRDNGWITLYNVPDLLNYTLQCVLQRPIQDFGGPTDNPDVPVEAFQALKWGLADELALEYASPQMNFTMIQQKAAAFVSELMDYEQEQASVFFTPRSR